jgi:signal peptidase II
VSSPNQRGRTFPLLLAVSMLIIALDRVTKIWIDANLPVGHFIPVIPHFLRISHWQNDGAAFSLFANSVSPQTVRWGLVAFTSAAILAILYFLFRLSQRFSATALALALILGGAIGNMYDRIRFASVIDFIEVNIFGYHWPDFNVADSAIVVGACLLLLDSFFTRPAPKSTD